MKSKSFILVLVVIFSLSVFSACSQEPMVLEETPVVNNEQPEDSNTDITEPVEAVEKEKVFVTAEWLKSVIDGEQEESENYIVLEAAWGTADDSPDYNNGHIPGAIHANTDSIEEGPIWNIRSAEEIEKAMLELGITKDTNVIIYGPDLSGAARVAYTYLWAGVENVKMLDGGLDAWKVAGYDLETTSNKAKPATEFGANIPVNPKYWLSIEDTVKKLKEDSNFRLVSIRSYEEFTGKTSSYSYIPKAGEPKGAIWGYDSDSYIHEDGTVITMDEMIQLWTELDFVAENEISFYCGTGWRAAIPFLIMYENGYTSMNMFDGGWNEWQMNEELPVQVGDPNTKDVIYTTVGELSNDKAK